MVGKEALVVFYGGGREEVTASKRESKGDGGVGGWRWLRAEQQAGKELCGGACRCQQGHSGDDEQELADG